MREPNIIIIGRKQAVINILITELSVFGRQVIGIDRPESTQELLRKNTIDLVIMGAGLGDEIREETKQLIQKSKASIPVHLMESGENPSPANMIDFTNKKAIEWKVQQVLGKHSS